MSQWKYDGNFASAMEKNLLKWRWLFENGTLVGCFSKRNIFMTKRDMTNPKLGFCRGRLGFSFHEKILVDTCWPNMWRFLLKVKNGSKTQTPECGFFSTATETATAAATATQKTQVENRNLPQFFRNFQLKFLQV